MLFKAMAIEDDRKDIDRRNEAQALEVDVIEHKLEWLPWPDIRHPPSNSAASRR